MSLHPLSLIVFIARFISSKLLAPVDKTIFFFLDANFERKGRLVISAEAILKKGTNGSRKSMASSSKGVERKSILHSLQKSANSEYSLGPKVSYFLNNSY